jgi:hypothetical protein
VGWPAARRGEVERSISLIREGSTRLEGIGIVNLNSKTHPKLLVLVFVWPNFKFDAEMAEIFKPAIQVGQGFEMILSPSPCLTDQ